MLLMICLFVSTAQALTIYTNGEYTYTLLGDGTAVIQRYDGNATELVIPDELDGIPVTALGVMVFKDDSPLTRITIPDSVTTIMGNPFHDCKSLTSIIVSSENPALEVIGGILIDKVEKKLICCPIGMEITSYDVPEGITCIGSSAFDHCTKLTSITLPESVTSIDAFAFRDCNNLTNINIPANVNTIGDYAFYDCDALSSLIIPAGVTAIGSEAFTNQPLYSSWAMNISKPNITLTVVRGSYAEQYAINNQIPCVYMTDDMLQQYYGGRACPYCSGGWRECRVCGTFGHCTYCSGQGYKSVYTSKGYEYRTCGVCNGTGACSLCGYSGFYRCSACAGTGMID